MLGYCCFLSVMHIISLCYVCLSSSTLLLLLFLGVFIVFAISKNNIIITFAYEILEGGSCMKWIRNAIQCHKGHYSNMIFNCKQNWAHYKMFIHLFLIYFKRRWISRMSIIKKYRNMSTFVLIGYQAGIEFYGIEKFIQLSELNLQFAKNSNLQIINVSLQK